MNIYTFYNLTFKNKTLNDLYDRVFIRLANILLPIYYYMSGLFYSRSLGKKENLNSEGCYIVSLTSFPVRIKRVWLAIESILRQKEKPDAIILWLSKKEFAGRSSLPKSLLRLEKWIQIEFCDDNLMPHNKYYHTLTKYPKANIITVDDDVIYPPNLIGDLKKCHKEHPNSISSTITRVIRQTNGKIHPYIEWNGWRKGEQAKSHKFLQLGVGGVLYPPGSLDNEIFNKEILKEKALKADDLWLKVMSLKNDTKIVSLGGTTYRKLLPILFKYNRQLMRINIGEGQNDKVFNDLLDHYQLKDLLFKDQKVFRKKKRLDKIFKDHKLINKLKGRRCIST